MTIQFHPRREGVVRSFLVLALFAFAVTAAAANINEIVVCSGTPGAGQFSTINAALAAAVADPSYTPGSQININITGTCTEWVKILNLSNVTLMGPQTAPQVILNQPQTGTDPNGPEYGPALEIRNSNTISIQNINFIGPGAALPNSSPLAEVGGSNVVSFAACNFSGATGSGIDVNSSQITVNGPSTIQNNTQQGINIAGASNVTAGGWNDTSQVTIRRNGQNGIAMSYGGYLFLYNYVTLTENGTPANGNSSGLEMTGSAALLCCGPGPYLDKNVGWGLDAEQLASVIIVGGNGTPALSLSNNTMGGINDVDSWVGIYNAATIQSNGDHTQTNPLGGINVLSNGSLQLFGATVQNNYGPGVLVSQSSSAQLVSRL